MDNNNQNINDKSEYYVIDLVHVLRFLVHRLWMIVLAGIVAASIGFSYASFVVEPTYSSSIMLYVNNSSVSLKDVGFSMSYSDINASQSLVKTYTVLLKNRTTLERVIEDTGVSYKWRELYNMIQASSVDETEVMKITVTTTDPYEAQKIANGISKVLPQRVTEIVEGTSMEVVDSAIANTQKVAPNISKQTAISFILGAMVAIVALVIAALMDNTIHDEDYVLKTYDYPILAKVPDLLESENRKYGYNKYGYGYYQSKKTSNQGGEDK